MLTNVSALRHHAVYDRAATQCSCVVCSASTPAPCHVFIDSLVVFSALLHASTPRSKGPTVLIARSLSQAMLQRLRFATAMQGS